MGKIFLAFMMLYACTAAQSHDFTSPGYAGGGAEYLKLPTHASTAGLGSAVAASRNDLANAQYNPAILDALSQDELYVMGTYSIMTLDRQHNGLDFAGNAGNYFVYGVSYMQYGIKNIPLTDGFGNPTGTSEEATNVLSASAAGRITNAIAIGAAFRYINDKLIDERANGIGFDIGATYQPLPFMSLGASVQNLGSYLWWSTGAQDPVLPTGRIGISGSLLKKTLLIETDFIKTQKQPEEVAAGIQYCFLDLLYVRGGINTAVDVEKQSSKYPDYSLGLGMRYLALGFDYACQIPDSRSLESVLGLKHKLTLCASIKNL